MTKKRARLMQVLFLIITPFILWLFSLLNNKPDYGPAVRSFYDNLHLTLSGIVYEIPYLGPKGNGLVYLSNIKSNKSNGYDATFRGKCVLFRLIKNRALVVGPLDQLQVGDSVSINTDKQMCKIYRNGKLFDDACLLGVSVFDGESDEQNSFFDEMNDKGLLDMSGHKVIKHSINENY